MRAQTRRWLSVVAVLALSQVCKSQDNLLRNPEFRFRTPTRGDGVARNVACWNCDAWGDLRVTGADKVKAFRPKHAKAGVVRLRPGKRLYQFSTLPEMGLAVGDRVALSVLGFQPNPAALRVRLTLMRIESADGKWSPKDFGCRDKRVFSRHGRGEPVRGPHVEALSSKAEGQFAITLDPLTVEAFFKRDRKSSAKYKNTVGVLVEFVNVGKGDVWVYAPRLVKGDRAKVGLAAGRPVPEYYRLLPRTMGKLMRGEPIHILALGSSIDSGDANPRLYVYDEDPKSPTYKQPMWKGGFDAVAAGWPQLKDYVNQPRIFLKYTGRMQRELMRKFNLRVSDILINAMSCGGSSIGESHSGFKTYATLAQPAGPANGHPPGKKWNQLYPRLFKDGKPAPDLVIFGHGHNERIDKPDGIAVYEGAVRWFQRRYPKVEFLFCQWHTRSKARSNIPPLPVRKALCEHYGIPFVDITPMVEGLGKSCNYFALCPDGGHAQAGSHYMWFKQLEQIFETADPLKPFREQRRLPKRINAYTYGWEGDMVRYKAPHPRIRGPRLIIEDSAFNLWCKDGTKPSMRLFIDGELVPRGNPGNGRQSRGIHGRNSSFVHGRLSLGDRHLLEVVSVEMVKKPGRKRPVGEVTNGAKVKILGVDCKVPPKRRRYGVESPRWRLPAGCAVERFASKWGAPYGDKAVTLKPGQTMALDVEVTDIAVAYVDQPEGGELRVSVDGKQGLAQPTNVPFVDTDKKTRYLENRKAVPGFPVGKRRVELRAAKAPVRVLGLYTYDRR